MEGVVNETADDENFEKIMEKAPRDLCLFTIYKKELAIDNS